MNFKQELEERISYIETVLKNYLPEKKGFQEKIMEAMEYSVMGGGKRVRPMLMLESYRMFGGEGKVIEPFMAAMEMIHTYSLVHDDLPAMDDDEYRRGRKTTHIVYGHAMGVLAGDALLNYAFETALSSFDLENHPGIPKALQVLANKAGIYGMIGGQVVDVESEGMEIPMEKLKAIHKMKTGALIQASEMIGAILAGASSKDIQMMEQVGADIGLAFQIQDDILDVTSTTKELGKPVFSDEKNHKTTYVTLKGLESAKADVEEISKRAMKAIDGFSGEKEFFLELVKALITRKK